MKWCPVCCTQHPSARDCPGELLATGAERYGRKITIAVEGRTEVIGVLVAEAGEHWRARVLTYPSMLWSVPGGRGAMKFVGKSAQDAEARAVAFIEEHCRKRGYKQVEPRDPETAGPVDREAAATVSPRAAADVRHPQRLPIRYGENRTEESGMTTDLSVGGLFIVTRRPLSKGGVVKMLLDVGSFTIPLTGTVAWVRVRPEKDRPQGMGIQLRNPPPMYGRYVRQLLQEAQDPAKATDPASEA